MPQALTCLPNTVWTTAHTMSFEPRGSADAGDRWATKMQMWEEVLTNTKLAHTLALMLAAQRRRWRVHMARADKKTNGKGKDEAQEASATEGDRNTATETALNDEEEMFGGVDTRDGHDRTMDIDALAHAAETETEADLPVQR